MTAGTLHAALKLPCLHLNRLLAEQLLPRARSTSSVLVLRTSTVGCYVSHSLKVAAVSSCSVGHFDHRLLCVHHCGRHLLGRSGPYLPESVVCIACRGASFHLPQEEAGRAAGVKHQVELHQVGQLPVSSYCGCRLLTSPVDVPEWCHLEISKIHASLGSVLLVPAVQIRVAFFAVARVTLSDIRSGCKHHRALHREAKL